MQSKVRTVLLLEQIAARDERALRELYDLHGGLLLGIATRLLHDRNDAEQVLIDVFAELWEHADRYDPRRGDPLTYLTLLMRSRTIDRMRSRRRGGMKRVDVMPTLVSTESGPYEHAASDERHEVLTDALSKLSPQQRQAVELAFLDGLSHAEIAERLAKPLGTIKTHVRQGLIQLRALLRKQFQGDPE